MWIAYMIKQFDKEKDPLKTVTLLNVINWTVEAWNYYVKPLTIERCWRKSTVVINPPLIEEDTEREVDSHEDLLAHREIQNISYERNDREHQEDLVELYNQIKNTPQLASLVPADQNIDQFTKHFIIPSEEVILEDEDVAFETIVERYAETDPAQIDLEEDPEPEKMPLVPTHKAIDMLEELCLHEFQQEDGIMEVIQVLQKHKQVIMRRKTNKATQKTLEHFWGAGESN
jgi:hypothetical protein